MKKLRKRFLQLLLVVILIVLAVPVINLLRKPSRSPLTQSESADPQFLAAAKAIEDNCLDCHAPVTQKPFYAAVPVIGDQIDKDISRGQRFINLVDSMMPTANRPTAETVLAKLEYVITHDKMPPNKYVLMHWNSSLSEAEKQAILAWIKQTRQKYYQTADIAPAFADGPLQPIPLKVDTDPAKVALGQILYFDTRLSGDGTLSCASCHGLDKGGCDQAPVSTGIDGQKGPINAPTVFNAVFYIDQFWDGRADDLVQQAGGPVTNPLEMGANWKQVIDKLKQDTELVKQFEAVYPDGLNRASITDAIAEFEKTLTTPNSAFDKYLRGDEKAMSEQAVKGYHLFTDRGCSNCHAGVAMGGQSYERMGLWRDYFTEPSKIKPVDYGRFNFTGYEQDRFKFKTPTLRNIALTYPYFHDASALTLETAVTAMATFQTESPLSETEIAAMVAFLKAQTGEYQDKSLTQ